MTWITMTTGIWLKKGSVRKSMKLQNIIETGIFTVHCWRRLLWLDNRFLKTRFQFKTSDVTAKMYDYVICIIMKKMMRCWVEKQTSLLIAWAIQIFQILLSIRVRDIFDRYFRSGFSDRYFRSGFVDRYFRSGFVDRVFSIGFFRSVFPDVFLTFPPIPNAPWKITRQI